jgi:hypothetical protein
MALPATLEGCKKECLQVSIETGQIPTGRGIEARARWLEPIFSPPGTSQRRYAWRPSVRKMGHSQSSTRGQIRIFPLTSHSKGQSPAFKEHLIDCPKPGFPVHIPIHIPYQLSYISCISAAVTA